MAKRIKAIDQESSLRISSGTVIPDLCCAVKELVENSLDAGATCIDVKLIDFGLESIEVFDNGPGILESDFEELALRSCTSKISEFEDLQSVESFGFRGEALNSLASLSDLVVHTKCKEASVGYELSFATDGKLTQKVPKQRLPGTTVFVRNLFKNLPVRREQLTKSAAKEYANLIRLLQSYALVSTGVRLSCSNTITANGKTSLAFKTTGRPELSSAITEVFGAETSSKLVKFQTANPTAEIIEEFGLQDSDLEQVFFVTGWISNCKLGFGRKTPDQQFLFFNKRPCTQPKVTKLINAVYKDYNFKEKPFFALDIQLDREHLDINIVPNKREVLVRHEKALLATIKSSMHRTFSASPSDVPLKKSISKSDSKPSKESQQPAKNFLDRFKFGATKAADTGSSSKPRIRTKLVSDDEDDETEEPSDSGNLTITQFFKRADPHPQPSSSSQLDDCIVILSQSPVREFPEPNDASHIVVSQPANPIASQQFSMSIPDSEAPANFMGFDDDVSELPVHQLLENDNEQHQESSAEEDRLSQPFSQLELPNEEQSIAHQSASEFEGFDRTSTQLFGNEEGSSQATFQAVGEMNSSMPLANQFDFGYFGESVADPPRYSRDISIIHDGFRSSSALTEQQDEMEPEIIITHRGGVELLNESHPYGHFGLPPDHSDSHSFLTPEAPRRTPRKRRAAGESGPRSRSSSGMTSPFQAYKKARADLSPSDKLDLSGNAGPRPRPGFIITQPLDLSGSQPDMVQVSRLDYELDSSASQVSRTTLSFSQESEFDGASSFVKPIGKVPSGTEVPLRLSIEMLERVHVRSIQHSPIQRGAPRQFTAEISPSQNDSAEHELQRNIGKEDFVRMEVIGQFNLGFIITRLDEELFIIDQHASDERFNYEDLQKTHIVQSQPMIRPLPLEMTAVEETILEANLPVFRKNGFDFEINPDSPTQRIWLKAVPLSREHTFGKDDVFEMIHLLNELGSVNVRPSKVLQLLASRACRKSVMIKDPLDFAQMKTIVEHMAIPDAPWKCAHGRPTIRHLGNVKNIFSAS